MKNNASFAYAVLLVIGDALALVAAFTLAYILRVKVDTRGLISPITAREYLIAFLTVLPLWLIGNAYVGLYSHRVYEKRFIEFGRLLVGSIVGILIVIGYDFAIKGKLFPARLVPIYGFLLGFSFLVLFRTIARFMRTILYAYGVGVSNTLIVGNTDRSTEIAQAIENTPKTGQRVIGIVGSKHGSFKAFENFDAALASIKRPIQSIIQTELYKDSLKNDTVLQYAQTHHIAYRFVPGNTDLFYGNIEVELYAGRIPMISVHQTALVGWGRIIKRLFDLVVSFVLLILTSPLLILIAIAVKVSDPAGPVFMRGRAQKRLTRHNVVFSVYKFRSHYAKYDGKTDSEVFAMIGKPELLKQYRDNGDQMDNDFRVTALGRFLRRSSLDELPQLINVFKGDISLVGPRALIPEELHAYEKKHTILSVKSGLTGLAQISGRRTISFEERRKLDTYYVQNWSFWMDIVIMIKTVRTVIRGLFES
jgi:exopolysaccharide biosynthesis polyprenyl glycosylphosphotransferase